MPDAFGNSGDAATVPDGPKMRPWREAGAAGRSRASRGWRAAVAGQPRGPAGAGSCPPAHDQGDQEAWPRGPCRRTARRSAAVRWVAGWLACRYRGGPLAGGPGRPPAPTGRRWWCAQISWGAVGHPVNAWGVDARLWCAHPACPWGSGCAAGWGKGGGGVPLWPEVSCWESGECLGGGRRWGSPRRPARRVQAAPVVESHLHVQNSNHAGLSWNLCAAIAQSCLLTGKVCDPVKSFVLSSEELGA